MPLDNPLQILIGDNYQSFLLTIQCNSVAIYSHSDGRFRIFDSHARDSFGLPHPQGTSVLLDVDNLNALINFFQTFYVNSTCSFELKGVCITEMYEQNSAREVMCKAADDDQPNNHSNTNINANILPNNCVNLRCCCAISLCCVCFSIIKSCSHWNSDTLDSISDHANIFYTQKFNINKQCLTMNYYPKCLQIYDADIHITFNFKTREDSAAHLILANENLRS